MKRAGKNIVIKTIALLLMGMMSILIANKIMFTHIHKLDDGTIITHAHPYSKTSDSKPFKTHNHTIAEFLFLSNFEIVFTLVFLILALLIIDRKAKQSVFSFQHLARACIIIHKGRAPPVLY